MKNKDIAEAFKEAKFYIKNHNSELFGTRFICYALQNALFDKRITKAQFYRAETIIRERIEGCYSLEGWLIEQGVSWKYMIPENIIPFKLKWLDLLIEEHSNEK